jgi:hypothetical protein
VLRFWFVLFVIGTVVLVVLMFLSTLHERVMPWACPRCHVGNDTDLLERARRWYDRLTDGRVQCRHCYTVFKEHPNGSLVEDRDS